MFIVFLPLFLSLTSSSPASLSLSLIVLQLVHLGHIIIIAFIINHHLSSCTSWGKLFLLFISPLPSVTGSYQEQ